jgi:hypothetical protein
MGNCQLAGIEALLLTNCQGSITLPRKMLTSSSRMPSMKQSVMVRLYSASYHNKKAKKTCKYGS